MTTTRDTSRPPSHLVTDPADPRAPRRSVIAHRGASGRAPENTLAAARLAVALGADAVEGDVRRTRDGVLVVIHDPHLRRTTDVRHAFPTRTRWQVSDYTLEEIKCLDAGSWFGREYAGEEVPTLAEWAEEIGGRASMLLDVKQPARYPGMADDLAAALTTVPALRAAVATGGVTVQSFDQAWLRTFSALAPRAHLALLVDDEPEGRQIVRAADFAHQLNPSLRAVSPEVVRRIQACGLSAHVWTPNSYRQLRRALRCGVDGVITDHPERARPAPRGTP